MHMVGSPQTRIRLDMDLKQLIYFAAAVDAGSITRGAARLGVAQPAVSRQIAALERELGVALLDRHGGGIRPTDAGRVVLEHSLEVRRRFKAVQDDLAALRVAPGGEVRLGVTPAMAEMLGPPLVARYREEFPHVLVKIQEGFGGHLRSWLLDGALDAAVIYETPRSRHLLCEDLLQEDLMLISPATDRKFASLNMPFRLLGELPLVLPGPNHSLRRLVERQAKRQRIPLTIIAEVDSIGALREMVRAGIGYSTAGAAPFKRQLDDGVLVATRLVRPSVRRRLALVTSAGQALNPAARALVRLAREQIQDLVRQGSWPAHLPA